MTYNDATDDFSVVVKNLSEDRVLPVRKFDYVIVETGHFSVPNIPSFPGMDKFPGRVLHSHFFRNASHFKDKKVLVVGSSLSAEDIALQCVKYGAKSIVCTWKTKPIGFSFPPQITERPLLTKIEGNTIHFKDGTSTEVDDIILSTGYRYSFPFLDDDLRLKTVLSLYPVGLYKGICWTQGGKRKLLYFCSMYKPTGRWITSQESFPFQTSNPRRVTAKNGFPGNGIFLFSVQNISFCSA